MKPFTYHLYHKPTNKHYYGVRYQKSCSPNDLWTTYFSSSSVIHKLIEDYGVDSFIPTVRKTFETAEAAKIWETKFLHKVKAQSNDNWLNRHNGGSTFVGPECHSESTKRRIGSKVRGTKRSESTKEKHRKNATAREIKRRQDGWTMPRDAIDRALKTRADRIKAGTINPYSEERNSKMANSKRGTKRHYLPDGSFIMVRVQSDQ